MPAAYRALDVVVHASTRPEPFGLVIAEAMACGRALVAAPDGTQIPLMAVVDVDIRRGPSQITRQNRQTSVAIQANLADGVTMPDARTAIETISPPDTSRVPRLLDLRQFSKK